MWNRLPLAAALVLVASACSGAASPPPSAGDPTRPPPEGTGPPTAPPERVILLDGRPMAPCRLGGAIAAVCGTLNVPEDPAAPGGRTIDLRVAVIPAQVSRPEPDPFVPLAGGPGGAATRDLTWIASTFGAIHRTRDILLVDQRGTGLSNELVLPAGPDVDDLDGEARTAAVQAWLRDALGSLDADPRWYTTSVAMDDLEAVRAALGYEQLNLYGPSYGGTAAQYYLRQHPGRVRTAVLDGATLLDVPIFERIAPNSQRALDLLFQRCAADAACHEAFPDVASEFRAVMARLAAEPVPTAVTLPGTGERVVLDAPTLAGAVHGALVGSDLARVIPVFVHLAASGRWDEAVRLALAAGAREGDGGPDLVMSLVIRCSEAWARMDADAIAATEDSYYTAVQLRIARDQATRCAATPAGIVPDHDGAPVRSDAPVLLVVGEADPQDPPENIADAPVELPNSRTVVAPGQGHTVGHLGCIPDVIAAFVEAGTTDVVDTDCIASTTAPPPFVLAP